VKSEEEKAVTDSEEKRPAQYLDAETQEVALSRLYPNAEGEERGSLACIRMQREKRLAELARLGSYSGVARRNSIKICIQIRGTIRLLPQSQSKCTVNMYNLHPI
jgi:hypothetical protein